MTGNIKWKYVEINTRTEPLFTDTNIDLLATNDLFTSTVNTTKMCDKIGYPSEKMARQKLNFIKTHKRLTSHIPKRCYYCKYCWLYHLTKSTVYEPRKKYLDHNN